MVVKKNHMVCLGPVDHVLDVPHTHSRASTNICIRARGENRLRVVVLHVGERWVDSRPHDAFDMHCCVVRWVPPAVRPIK